MHGAFSVRLVERTTTPHMICFGSQAKGHLPAVAQGLLRAGDERDGDSAERHMAVPAQQ